MVLSSLKGSTFTAILLSGGASLQAVQILCVYLVREEVILGAELGKRVTAVLALVALTGIFCIIFWLLKLVPPLSRMAVKVDPFSELRTMDSTLWFCTICRR